MVGIAGMAAKGLLEQWSGIKGRRGGVASGVILDLYDQDRSRTPIAGNYGYTSRFVVPSQLFCSP